MTIQALSLIDAPSTEGSQTELQTEVSFSSTKPERSDKQQELFNRLQDSLSAKISETLSKEETDEGKEEQEERSVSPCSTVSSSGEVEGEYIVNPDQEQEQEEEIGQYMLY